MAHFAIVGPGHAGSTLAGALKAAGHLPVGVWGRSLQTAQQLAEKLHTPVYTQPSAALSSADWIFFTVPDTLIAPVAERYARSGLILPHSVFIHLAGTWGPHILPAGWPRLALHPCVSLQGFDQSLQQAPLVAEADAPAAKVAAERIAASTGAHLLRFPGTDRATYHALCALTANLVPALLQKIAMQLRSLGFTFQEADELITSLLDSGWRAVRTKGATGFTGPLVRGDVQTVQHHLSALQNRAPGLAACYRQLSQLLLASLSEVSPAQEEKEGKNGTSSALANSLPL
ncbi:MAG: DUF2520 domain-containing protein [Firmicutes bacterium]|nr:DUF2520 domain-containing protein [Bacillota bacterium]